MTALFLMCCDSIKSNIVAKLVSCRLVDTFMSDLLAFACWLNKSYKVFCDHFN